MKEINKPRPSPETFLSRGELPNMQKQSDRNIDFVRRVSAPEKDTLYCANKTKFNNIVRLNRYLTSHPSNGIKIDFQILAKKIAKMPKKLQKC